MAWGDILRVNLSNGEVRRESVTEEMKRNFIGGRGINSKLLYDEVKPGADPLNPKENILIFGTGPLHGTYYPSCCRCTVTSKSPLTGIHGDSNFGGRFPTELKLAGIQHIVIYGGADKPVYLSIDNDKVEIRDATHLWNKDTWEAQKIIKQEWKDPRVQVATIGPAGENLVKYATIITGVSKTAGRAGMGAVMGSKKLKAIAVRGTKGVKVAHPKEFRRVALEAHKFLRTNANCQDFRAYGVEGVADYAYDSGGVAAHNGTRNYMDPEPDYVGHGKARKKADEFTAKHRACVGCPLGCIHRYVVKEGPYIGTFGENPHLIGILLLAVGCDLYYYPGFLKIVTSCNQWGLDLASLGTIMAAAMEWYEKGIITKQDTNGIELNFSDHEAFLQMARNIAFREGFGDLLAEGGVNAARKIGRGAEYYVQHSKLLEEAYTYRDNKGVKVNVALSRAVSSRGADHLRGEGYSASDIPKILGRVSEAPPMTPYEFEHIPTIWQENLNAVQDSLNNCRFAASYYWGLELDYFANILSVGTGLDFSGGDLIKIGARIYNVERAFSCREGLTRKDDTLPKRIFKEPIPDTPEGVVVDEGKFEKLKTLYYERRGWDVETGIPGRQKLEELGLKYIADELEGVKGKKSK